MMKWISVFSSVTLLAIFLMATSTARAQVVPGSVMVGGDAGYVHTSIPNDSETYNRYTFGATGGYNLDKWVGAFFEYNYVSILNQDMGEGVNASAHVNNYGGAARFYPYNKGKIIPYGIFDGGGAQLNESVSGEGSISVNGNYVGGGAGALVYLGRNWGVAPDFRFNRYSFTYDGYTVNPHVVTVLGGVFYQFGGTRKAK